MDSTKFQYSKKELAIQAAAVLTIIVLVVLGSNPRLVEGATYTFTQNDWSGGNSVSTTGHPPSSWNKFQSQASTTVGVGSIILATGTIATTQTSDTDFNAGTFSNAIVTGSGAGASVILANSSPPPAWTIASSSPSSFGDGAAFAYVAGSSSVYALRGGNSNGFLRYSVASGTWANLTVVPSTVTTGGALVYPGSGDYLYAFRGGSSSTFYRYSLSGDSWTSMAPVTSVVNFGGSLVYPSSGDYIYALPGNTSSTFLRYSISGNAWSAVSSTPAVISSGAGLVYPGSGDFIYATVGGSNTTFYKYSISGNTWSALTDVPTAVFNGGSITSPGSGDYLYAFTGNSTYEFYRYSISGNSWAALASDPSGSSHTSGAALVAAGSNTIFANPGGASTGFFKYTISADSLSLWSAKANALFSPGNGASMIYPGSGDFVYLLRGVNSPGLFRYSISGNSWGTMTGASANIGAGGALSLGSSSDYLYALVGAGTNTFLRYSISGNSWATMATTTATVNSGGAMVYPVSGDYIYALVGNNGVGFIRYSLSGNSWSSLTNAPAGINAGAQLIYPNSGDYIYALRGGNATDFYRYSISGNSWATMTPAPMGLSGGAGVYPNSGDYMYFSGGSGTAGRVVLRYSISGNIWAMMPNYPVSAFTGNTMAYASVDGGIYMTQGSSLAFYRAPALVYQTPGTFTSGVIDLGGAKTFTALQFTSTTPTSTTLTVDIRAGNTATPDGTWTAWQTGITNGGSLSALSGNRYVQYRANLGTTDGTTSPTLNDLTINTQGYLSSGYVISSPYDTGDATNVMSQLSWDEGVSLPANTTVTVSLRTASSSGGLASSTWSDFTNATSNCSKAASSVTCGAAAIPAGMKDGAGDRWWQYKVTLGNTGANTPAVTSVAVRYVVNAPPQFDPNYPSTNAGGAGAVQDATSSDPNFGKVVIGYSVEDPDTLSGTFSPGFITPSFEYNAGGGWVAIPSQYLDAGATNNKAVSQSAYSPYQAIWDAKTQIPNVYATSTYIRVTANDNEGANNITQASSPAFILDTKTPTATLIINANSATATLQLSLTDDSLISYSLSNNASATSPDGMNGASGQTQSVGSTSLNLTASWNLNTSGPYIPVYGRVTDAYGNATNFTGTAPGTPMNVDLKDTSNPAINSYREFLSWKVYAPTTTSPFSSYKVYRSTDSANYSLLTTITDPSVNYYIDSAVNGSTTYYYKIRVLDNYGDVSPDSAVVSDLPNGQGGTDFTPPVISGVAVAQIQSTWAKITWTTDEISDSEVDYSVSPSLSFGTGVSVPSYVTGHSVTVANLQPNTSYLFRVRSKDIFNNQASNDNAGVGYTFMTTGGPIVSNVAVKSAGDHVATIVWNTNTNSNSFVDYSVFPDLSTPTEVGNSALVAAASSSGPFDHSVDLSGLTPGIKYYFYVKSTDGNSNTTIDNNSNNYYSFATTYDRTPPVISNITTPVLTPDSAVVVWTTNEPANTQVQYGSSTGVLPNFTATDPLLTLSHVVTLGGLTESSPYYYVVHSTDQAGNAATSSEGTLSTTAKSIIINQVSVGGGGVPAIAQDTTPPQISGITVDPINPFDATISFNTDEPSVGFAEYGKDPTYGLIGSDAKYVTAHQIFIKGLTMGTEYHFKVRAIDRAGNTAVSADQKFTTKYLTEALSDSQKLENASQFQDEIENALQSALPSLVAPFIEKPAVSDITENSATVNWRTNIKSFSVVSYATDDEYDAKKDNPYANDAADIATKVFDHQMQLLNLKPNTLYHFMVKSFSLPQAVGKSDDMTFTTKASKIQARVTSVRKDGFTVAWTTNDPTNSMVEYRNVKTKEVGTKTENNQVFNHEIKVDALPSGVTYDVKVSGYNSAGNLVEAKDLLRVKTSLDVVPPEISNMKIETVVVPQRTDRAQAIVNWKTDEPGTSVVFYDEGSGAADAPLAHKVEDPNNYVSDHTIVIPNLIPGAIYRIKIGSADQSGNAATSPVRTIIIPQQGESVFDVIFKNFEDTFKFLRTTP